MKREAARGPDRTCAWYSMLGSCRLFRQIAHVSVSTFHDHTATAFHFFTLNLRRASVAQKGAQRKKHADFAVGCGAAGSAHRCWPSRGVAAVAVDAAAAAPPPSTGSGSDML